MNAEDPDFKPGFLRGLYDAEGATPPPPAGGWQRLESELGGRRKRPMGWFWMAATLLAGLVGYWTLLPAPTERLMPGTTAQDVQLAPATSSSQEKVTGASTTHTPNQEAAQTSSVSLSESQTGTASSAVDKASAPAAERTGTGPTTKTNPDPKTAIALAKRRTMREPRSGNETSLPEQKPLDKVLLSDAGASTTGTHAKPYSTNPVSETGARSARARQRGKAAGVGTMLAAAKRSPQAARSTETSAEVPASGTPEAAVAQQNQPTSLTEQPISSEAVGEPTNETNATLTKTQAEPVPAVAAIDSAKTKPATTETADAAKVRKPEEVAKKKEPSRLSWELGAHLLVRQRVAALSAREDRAKLTWSTPQPNILPGLELYGGLGYRLNRSLVVGGSLGLGLWQERLAVDVEKQDSNTTMTALGADVYQMAVGYQNPIRRTSQWMVAQTHTELWLRLAPEGAPVQLQVGPTVDVLTTFARVGDAAAGTRAMPGVAASLRFTSGRMYYDLGMRKPFGKAFNIPGYYTLQYQQLVTVGFGYTW